MKSQVSLWENYLHQRALQVGLTSQQKEIFLLIFGERKSRQEVSEFLNISANACQQCLGEVYSKFNILSRSRGKERSLYVQLRKDFQKEFALTDAAVQTLQNEGEFDRARERPSERLSSSPDELEQVVEWLEEKIIAQGEKLKDVDRLILKGAWERRSYKQLAEESSLSLGYLQSDAGASLWKLLTQVLGSSVTKRNLRTVIEGQMQQQLYPSQTYQVPSADSFKQTLEQVFETTYENPALYLPGLEALAQNFKALIVMNIEETSTIVTAKIQSVLGDEIRNEAFVQGLYRQGFQHFHDSQLEMPRDMEKEQCLKLAEFYLLLVLVVDPSYQLSYYTLGEVYLGLSDVKRATEYLAKMRDYLEKASTYFHKSRVFESMKPWALNYLGYISIYQEDYPKSEHLLIQALYTLKQSEREGNLAKLLSNPDDIRYLKSAILKNLGWAIFSQKQPDRYPEAEAKLEEAIELDDEYAPPYCLLAQVKEALGKPPQKEWKKCLALASPCRGPEEADWIKIATERSAALVGEA